MSKLSEKMCFYTFLLGLSMCIFMPDLYAATITPTYHNTPLVGVGRIVDKVSAVNGNLDNVLDGNLNNSVTISTVVVASETSLISVKDVKNSFAAGTRTGFVISPVDGLLTTNNLGGFEVKTYLNNVLQETLPLSVTLMGNSGGKYRVSAVTTKTFDEVELLQLPALVGITSINLYYAFVEPNNVYDYLCTKPLVNSGSAGYTGITVSSARSCNLVVTCPSINNADRIIDNTLTNSGSIVTIVGLGDTASVSVKMGSNPVSIPASSDVGFVIDPGSLISANLLGGYTMKTYLNGVVQESRTFSSVVDLVILSGTQQAISFKTTKAFNEVRFTVKSLLAAAQTIQVYYAFVRQDTDNDGFTDCVDKAPGADDGMDANGNGIPDAIDTSCNFNAGMNVTLCTQETTYDFSSRNLGTGLTWSVLTASPAGATVNSTGLVQNMNQAGTYYIRVANSTCADTIQILKTEMLVNAACNNPITGPDTEIYDPTGNSCLLCLTASASNVISADLNAYAELTNLVSIASSVPIVGVRDKVQVYPAGRRAGFVFEPLGGLLSASVLSGLEIRTYLNGVLQESVAGNNGLVTAALLAGNGNKQRISFVTTKPFNSIVLYANSALSVLSRVRVYYAFEEPANGCSSIFEGNDCSDSFSAANKYKASIEYARTGVSGVACVNCNVNNVGNIIDSDPTTYATITRSVGVAAEVSVSVKTVQTIDAGYQAGFIISGGNNLLLDLSILAGMRIRTYYNGVLAENVLTSDGLVSSQIINQSTGQGKLTFKATKPFNEIQFSVFGVPTGLENVRVYGVSVVQDTDGDGVPDCADKCCLGNDNYNTDGDGIPDSCDLNVITDASCTNCPAKIIISPAVGYTYNISRNNVQMGVFDASGNYSFSPVTSGSYVLAINAISGTHNYLMTNNLSLTVHPARATWTPTTVNDTLWQQPANWRDDASGLNGSPLWCTDVTIPSGAVSYPILIAGDNCRDITLKHGVAVEHIQRLKYRHAFVEFNPARNQWVMASAPLRYMYSGDYSADYSWTDAVSPKIFMRYFDVNYSTSAKPNPDGVTGTSVGNFSRAFANLSENLPAGSAFAIWVNGTPYAQNNLPASTPFKFPRRNESDSTDVQFSYHTADGQWAGEPFYLTNRGVDIKTSPAWTATSTPEYGSRFRFVFEEKSIGDVPLQIPMEGGRAVMVGNPYMSHLDFNQLCEDNPTAIQFYYRTWDGSQFSSYMYGSGTQVWSDLGGLTVAGTPDAVASRYIAPMQAFFLETKGTGAVNLNIMPHATTTKRSSMLRNATVEHDLLRLRLTAGTSASHAIVASREAATDSYNNNEDVFKLFSSSTDVPEIYTVADGVGLEINAVGSLSNNQLIPVGIKTTQTGEMRLSVTGVSNMEAYSDVYLIDSKLAKEYNLRETESVSFTKDTKDNLEGRFFISLSNPRTISSIETDNFDNGIKVSVISHVVTVSSSSEKILSLYLFDALGKLNYRDEKVNTYSKTINTETSKGVYLLKVNTESGDKVYKVSL